MKISTLISGCAAAALLGWAASASAAAPITASYYLDYTDTGSSITFSGTPFASDMISSINNESDPTPVAGNSDPLFPNADINFAADYTTKIDVATSGVQDFSYAADDTGYFFIDGTLVSSEPGNHIQYTTNFPLTLSAGLHTLEFQMDNAGGPCCATAVVTLPTGVTYAGLVSAAPEPGTWALMFGGIAMIGGMLRVAKARRREDEVAAIATA